MSYRRRKQLEARQANRELSPISSQMRTGSSFTRILSPNDCENL